MATPAYLNIDDTITAIATPIGVGGIGVIKISGPQALATVETLFRKKNSSAPSSLRPRHFYTGYIVDPEKEEPVDEVMVVSMPGPSSYTGEDVVEIQCHSGYAVLEKILDLVLTRQSLRLSEPGEFTRRAFLNGRMDLTQVEAVLDIVAARTSAAQQQAAAQLGGALHGAVERFRGELRNVLVHLESAIDFPDEDIEFSSREELGSRLTVVLEAMRRIRVTYDEGRLVRVGIRAAIIGRPNVGKSSLLNALLEEERALVCHLPGTTRDTIEESINVGGIAVTFIDTAGLSTGIINDPVEQMGTERTRRHAGSADVVLFILDGSCSFSQDDRSILEEFIQKDMVVIVNKSDLPQVLDRESLPAEIQTFPCVSISAKYRDNITGLRALLQEHLLRRKESTGPSSVIITRLRHKVCLEKAIGLVDRSIQGIDGDLSAEFVALDVREALDSLGEVLGDTTAEEILDQIFSEFCIGK